MQEVMNNRFVIELKDEIVQVSISELSKYDNNIDTILYCQTYGIDENDDSVQLQHAIEKLEKEKSIILANHDNELTVMK